MAYNSTTGQWDMEEDNVASGVENVINQNSGLMKQAATTGKQYANKRGLLNSSMGAQASQAAVMDRALPIAGQQSAQTHTKNLAQMDINSASALQGNDIASKQGLMDTDIASKERIASQNIAAHDREKATSGLAAMESVYADMFKNIAANNNIPAAERNKYNAHIGNLRDSSLNLVEQMYDVDLDWGETGTAQV
tara:strand:- start:534 stop:1115 length:582 start_codon:yes stop_codon:yes gene_type:complete